MIVHYKYRIKKKRTPVSGKQTPTVSREAEELTGMVNGFAASDLEERFAKALDKKNVSYYFRYALGDRGLPGWRELDFLVVWFGYHPVEIEDLTFIHKGQKSEDDWKDAQTMYYLRDYNPYPVKHVNNTELFDQDAADAAVRRLFL